MDTCILFPPPAFQSVSIPRLIKDALLLLITQMFFFKAKHSFLLKFREDSDLCSVGRVCTSFNPCPTTNSSLAVKKSNTGNTGRLTKR